MVRKLVHGVGVNDSKQNVINTAVINGERVITWRCPYYKVWFKMIDRCYSKKYLKSRPSYLGCSVCNEWLIFSNFKAWMEQQDWEGKHLDKDILVKGNKIYSPETCVFVDASLNNFTTESDSSRGMYMIGVDKPKSKYRAQCCNPFSGRCEHLGYFSTEIEAHNAWLKRKMELSCILAGMQKDDRVRDALLTRYY